ncbi:hypothetical protein ABVN80_00540 [Acinetobacter baumannii]
MPKISEKNMVLVMKRLLFLFAPYVVQDGKVNYGAKTRFQLKRQLLAIIEELEKS